MLDGIVKVAQGLKLKLKGVGTAIFPFSFELSPLSLHRRRKWTFYEAVNTG
jgi:hypothetical protein